MSRLTLIVAATATNGIGQNGRLPWRLPKEMAYFARVTTAAPEGYANAVIMGRNTWESIPAKFKPLPNRVNIVMSRNEDYQLTTSGSSAPSVLRPDLASAIARLTVADADTRPIHRAFVIGGAALYAESLALLPKTPQAPFADRVLLTRIIAPAFEQCDAFMPDFIGQAGGGGSWERAPHETLQAWVGFDVPEGEQEENGVRYEFQMWVR